MAVTRAVGCPGLACAAVLLCALSSSTAACAAFQAFSPAPSVVLRSWKGLYWKAAFPSASSAELRPRLSTGLGANPTQDEDFGDAAVRPAAADSVGPDATFTLPIFPLRKAVRFPTDVLTLNLYEPRYLALCEYVLDKQRDTPVFGAAFASHKTQLVRRGTEPIVPVFEPGDTGVVCFVRDWLEGDVPTRDGKSERRRIRLMAVAVGRFRIRSVLRRGSGAADDSPFVLAEVSWLFDEETDTAGNEHRTGANKEANDAMWEFCNGLRDVLSAGDVERADSDSRAVLELIRTSCLSKAIPRSNDTSFQNELFSFAVAGQARDRKNSSWNDLKLLNLVSTATRLNELRGNRGWLSRGVDWLRSSIRNSSE